MPRRKKVENLSLEEMLMKTEQEIKTTEAELKTKQLEQQNIFLLKDCFFQILFLELI